MQETKQLIQNIDWNLPPREFEELVSQVIHQFTAAGKVLPLPVKIRTDYAGMELLFIMLSKIDCGGCDAACCREQPDRMDEVAMSPLEYEDLKGKYPAIMREVHLDTDHITTPCPLLKDGRCQVYHDRPFVCWLYPFQFGGATSPTVGGPQEEVASLSSSCTGARKLAKAIYLNRYQLRRSLQRLGVIPKD